MVSRRVPTLAEPVWRGSFCFGVYSKLFCFGARRNMYLVNFNSFWPCKISPVFLFKLSRMYKIIWEAINSRRCGLEKIQDKQRLSVLTTRNECYLAVPWVLPLKTFWQQIWQSKEAYCYECLRFFILKNNLKKKKDLPQPPTSQFLRENQRAFFETTRVAKW